MGERGEGDPEVHRAGAAAVHEGEHDRDAERLQDRADTDDDAPAPQVGQVREHRLEHEADRRRHEDGVEDVRAREALRDAVADDPGAVERARRERTEDERDGQEQVLRVAEHLDERHLRLLGGGQIRLLAGLGEHRALLDPELDPQTDQDEHGREQERDAPAPLEERVAGQRGRRREDPVGQQDPAVEPHLCDRAGQAAALRCVLHGHEHGPAPLAAGRHALDQAHQHQDQRRPDADRRVGGQQSHDGRRHAHQHDGQHEHPLAADPVAEVAPDDPAEGPGDEACGQGGERGEGAGRGAELGEVQLPEHGGRGDAEEVEVVPLDDRSDEARQEHPVPHPAVRL
ncbi:MULTISPECIES: hypothetical protein [unclassified Pseudonocardia]|uniref:hypothetical protein n=1 Tax=Pseudonocardia sp. Ae150A_Ps1 TaxID=1885028 RepID=UPI001483C33E|nr:MULTISPECIES: hypothetical protein [unclassified Pseudonocardia]